jgi:hypothetical protein
MTPVNNKLTSRRKARDNKSHVRAISAHARGGQNERAQITETTATWLKLASTRRWEAAACRYVNGVLTRTADDAFACRTIEARIVPSIHLYIDAFHTFRLSQFNVPSF